MVLSARGEVVISKLELELSVISLLELARCCLRARALLPQHWNLLEPLRYALRIGNTVSISRRQTS
jgi:hypothetical protein